VGILRFGSGLAALDSLFSRKIRLFGHLRKEEALYATEQGIALLHWGGEELYYFVRNWLGLEMLSERSPNWNEPSNRVSSVIPLERDPWLDSLRSGQRFSELLPIIWP
jgi:hypothetical protein